MKTMMKTTMLSLLMLASLNPAHASESLSSEPSAELARSTWQAMTPEQQAAAKTMMKETAQEKKAAWGALPEEDKAAKLAAMKEKMQPLRAQMQARMATRPYGRR